MLAPIFTHGTLENTIKAIAEGKIKYPGYCWCTDTSQYGFINKNNKLEMIGIPILTGTLENKVVLSSLYDGLYQIKGQYIISANYPTTFITTSPIIAIIQTINGIKKIRTITADDIVSYIINEDLSVTPNIVVTKDYLDDNEYVTEGYVDAKMAAMEAVIMADVESALPAMLEPILRPVVEEVVDETIQDIDSQNIEDLFNE